MNMGKFTKMALVVLYLLQLVVVFRDQLAHLYRTAVETVSSETQNATGSRQGAVGAIFEKVVKISSPEIRETLSATAALAAPATIANDASDQAEDFHHDDDKNADRERKQRHHALREYLTGNLWKSIRRMNAVTERDELSNAVDRILTFA
jgi:hypothetical protein